MAENFNLIWGSNASQSTTWSDSDYQRGWETVGDTPPTAQQFDALQRRNDLKAQELNNTIAPIAEANDANNRKPQTFYKVGDMQYDSQLPTGWYLLCTVGGTSGDGDITFPTPLTEDASVMDGTVVWRLHKLSTSVANIDSIEKSLAESTGYGIISGCMPTISGLNVTVAAGVVHLADGTRKEIAQTNITLDNADSSNPRIDLVYIDSTGTVAKITGTAAASPSAPALPANGISVAQVSVAANATAGTLTDVRGILARWYNTDAVSVKDFGALGNGTGDDSDAIQSALDCGANVIIFPAGYYNIGKPLTIPKQGMSLIGAGNASSILQASFTDNGQYADDGMINFVVGTPDTDSQVWGSWGLVVRHLMLNGGNKKIHGFKLRKISYPLFYDVNIAYFSGAGIYLDKCQDGLFQACNIQRCGVLNDGETDVSDITKCKYAALELLSTVSGDDCNMLRFNGCQIEENNCSPYVRVMGSGAIGIMFSQTHGEDRTGSNRHWFMYVNGADVTMNNNYFSNTLLGGIKVRYGTLRLNNGRNSSSVESTTINTTSSYLFVNENLVDISIKSQQQNSKYVGCSMSGNFTMTWVNGTVLIENCTINGDFSLTGDGSGKVLINNCIINGDFTKSGSTFMSFCNSVVNGTTTISGTNNNTSNNYINGAWA